MAEARIKHEQDLLSISSKDAKDYEDLSLAALTIYSLYWLHQWELRRTIEAVSVLNWRLFPNKFAMVGWIQFPDAFRTNRSLLQGQPKYRNWLTGAASTGFSLNEKGIEVARELIEKLGVPTTTDGDALGTLTPLISTVRKSVRPRSIEPEREINKVRESRLFDKWKSGVMSDRDLIHVHSLLGIFDHTPVNVRKKRMKDLERSAADIEDNEIRKFLDDVQQSFPSVFDAGRK
jgi:hypothetical protein